MQAAAEDLRRALREALPVLRELDEAQSVRPPAPGKWSPRELLGHLIDSASNNHQRFVRARFQEELVFPGYDQDAWVAVQGYRTAPWHELIELWRLFNLQLARVFEGTPAELATRVVTRHNLDCIAWRPVPAGEPTSLAYFAHDYVGHLRHHLSALGVPVPAAVASARSPRVRRATAMDAEVFARQRLALFRELGGLAAGPESERFEAATRAAFVANLERGTSLAWLALASDVVLGSSALYLVERLPSPSNPGPLDGYLGHLFVGSEHRRAGLGSRLVGAALEAARARRLSRIRLHATETGRMLYESLGFRMRTNDMEREIAPGGSTGSA